MFKLSSDAKHEHPDENKTMRRLMEVNVMNLTAEDQFGFCLKSKESL